jgi:hypothetical protein
VGWPIGPSWGTIFYGSHHPNEQGQGEIAIGSDAVAPGHLLEKRLRVWTDILTASQLLDSLILILSESVIRRNYSNSATLVGCYVAV